MAAKAAVDMLPQAVKPYAEVGMLAFSKYRDQAARQNAKAYESQTETETEQEPV